MWNFICYTALSLVVALVVTLSFAFSGRLFRFFGFCWAYLIVASNHFRSSIRLISHPLGDSIKLKENIGYHFLHLHAYAAWLVVYNNILVKYHLRLSDEIFKIDFLNKLHQLLVIFFQLIDHFFLKNLPIKVRMSFIVQLIIVYASFFKYFIFLLLNNLMKIIEMFLCNIIVLILFYFFVHVSFDFLKLFYFLSLFTCELIQLINSLFIKNDLSLIFLWS